VVNVKDKKTIVYKNERSKRVAYNLRRLILEAAMNEWSHLGEEQKRIRLECEHKVSKREVNSMNDLFEINSLKNEASAKHRDIENERSDLYGALNASICECSCCNQVDRDMVYNAPLKEWYCTLCVQRYRDFYHKKKAILDRGGFVGDYNEGFHETFL
jgi:hypothetical protein